MKRLLSLLAALALVLGLTALPALAYSDVDESRWYAPCIDEVTDLGLMDGVGNDSFQPQNTLTRAMTVTVLWRLAGKPEASTASPFADVSASAWYAQAVNWAAETGAINGTTPTTFAPTDPVTREQLAAIFYRYAQSIQGATEALGDLTQSDRSSVSAWAADAVTWAASRCFLPSRQLEGASVPQIAPKDAATRAEVAVFLARFALSLPEDSDLSPAVVTPVAGDAQAIQVALSAAGQEVYPTLELDGNKNLCTLSLLTALPAGATPAADALTYDALGRLTGIQDIHPYAIQYDGHGNPAFLIVSASSSSPLVFALHYSQGETSWQWTRIALDGGSVFTPTETNTSHVYSLS